MGMERPHEILGRTLNRRHPHSDQQRVQQDDSAQDANYTNTQYTQPTNYTQQAPRRQPSEQAARMNKHTYNGAPSQHASSRVRHSQQTYNQHKQTNRSYDESPSRPAHTTYNNQRPAIMDSMSAYQTRPVPQQDHPRIQPLQPRPVNDYYPMHASDDYSSSLHSDAIEEEWEEEGMGYGYFEEDEEETYEDEVEFVEEQDAYKNSRSQSRHSMTQTDPNARATRNLRSEPRNYASPLNNIHVPRHEQPRYQQHRVTQPLDPQTAHTMNHAPEMRREPETTSRQTDPRLPRPRRAPQNKQETQQSTTTAPTQIAPIKSAKVVCPHCRGAGFLRADVPYGHPNFGKPVACECKEAERREKRRQQLIEMSNISAFRNHTFNTFTTQVGGIREAHQAALEFAANPTGWLLLVGPNGCGKTHLAAAIANQVMMESDCVVLFEPVPDLLDHLRAAFAPTAKEVYDQLFSKMREAELLILDDLGAQQSSPWATEKLFQLLNYRYNNSYPTVITANQKGLNSIDERIRSRLGDISLVRSIQMDRARDFRPTNVKKRQ